MHVYYTETTLVHSGSNCIIDKSNISDNNYGRLYKIDTQSVHKT